MGNLDTESLFNLRLIQYGILRTRSFGRILVRMQRADFTRGNARHAVNGHRKIIPGAYSLVAEMINTGDDALIDSRKDGTCQIVGISRRTDLVENNSQPLDRKSVV